MSLPLVHILSQMHQFTSSQTIFLTSILILSSYLRLGFPSGLSLQVFRSNSDTHFLYIPCVLHDLISSYLILSPK